MQTRFTIAAVVLAGLVLVPIVSAQPPTTTAPAPQDLPGLLHQTIFVRTDQHGREAGHTELDPLLWRDSTYLLTDPRRTRLITLLDELERTGVEPIEPLGRTLLQHDLWSVFDWTDEATHAEASRLRAPLARAIVKLALDADQAAALPDNYALAVKSGRFPAAYEDATPQAPFLPPDLFDPDGPWVCFTRSGAPVLAAHHARHVSGRSVFLAFINLPGGREATLAYLKELTDFPDPYELRRREPVPSERLPQFPAGTKVALVRQMLALDRAGRPMPTPIVQSIQIRVFRKIADAKTMIGMQRAGDYQSFVEFVLDRPAGLRAVQPDEQAYITLMHITGGSDRFEADPDDAGHRRHHVPVLQTCASCHERGGVYSVNSLITARFGPPDFNLRPQPTTPREEVARTIYFKLQRHDIGVLQGLLEDRPAR